MKTIAELEAIREKTLKEVGMRTDNDSIRVVVGMATCGIAAGARPVMQAFLAETQKRDIHNVTVTATGCIGVCSLEPLVDIIDKEGHKVTYVNMTPEKVAKVVLEHLANGKVCSEYTLKENQ